MNVPIKLTANRKGLFSWVVSSFLVYFISGFHGEFTIEKQTIKQVKGKTFIWSNVFFIFLSKKYKTTLWKVLTKSLLDEEIVAQVRGKRKRQEKRQRCVVKRGRPKRLKPVIDVKTAVTTESQLVLGEFNWN